MADKTGYIDAIDGSAELANAGQTVEIYHIPSKYSVIFKAMMTQFEDAYTSNWTSEQAYGRMDPLQTYQNTSRVMSMGFDVVASSQPEAVTNLQKVSSLAQFLYPAYDADGLISSSPFCRIQFMNWSTDAKGLNSQRAAQTGLMGTINGFTFAPDLDAGVFDDGAENRLYPKKLNVSFSFTVLHNHAMGWAETESGLAPRAGLFPYIGGVANDASLNLDDTDAFSSVVSEIQTTEVPIDVRAEAIKQDLLRDKEKFEDDPISWQDKNRLRRHALQRKTYSKNVKKSGGARSGTSALGSGGSMAKHFLITG